MVAGVCRVVAALAMVCLSCAAVAQVIPPGDKPGRERERFAEPPTPRAQPGGTAITLPSTVAPAGAEKIRLVIRAVKVTGSTVYKPEDLAALYRDVIGQTGSLQTVYEIARRITAKYGGDGYVLSRAIVPPQVLSPRGAEVRIEVVEGYVDKVEWPAKLARYRDFFTDYAAKITADRPANIRTIERYLLLAGDLPGLKISTTLQPSKRNVGASTLVVEVTEKPLDAQASVDNRGTPARGPREGQGTATLNNLLGAHEAFSATYATVERPKELQYVQGVYRQVLTSEGLAAFINASYGWGRPGTPELEAIDYATRATYAEAGMSYPVVRARERNLTLSGLAFLSDNFSDLLSTPFNRDRLRGIRLKADADMADSLNGINLVNVTYSEGFRAFGAMTNEFPTTPNGRVNFAKIEAYASRTQALPENFSLLLAAYGQHAFTPLLVSEQCSFGGRTFGRAYDPSQILGDSCYEALAELRYDLPPKDLVSKSELYGFADYGMLSGQVGALDPTTHQPGKPFGASAGFGLRMGLDNHISADVSVAKAIAGFRNDERFFFILTARN
jgi:hemolysin activation/secretion protein